MIAKIFKMFSSKILWKVEKMKSAKGFIEGNKIATIFWASEAKRWVLRSESFLINGKMIFTFSSRQHAQEFFEQQFKLIFQIG